MSPFLGLFLRVTLCFWVMVLLSLAEEFFQRVLVLSALRICETSVVAVAMGMVYLTLRLR